MALEMQLRQAIRDAVNRPSRKPFHWGGLAGYRQLEAMAHTLHMLLSTEGEKAYLQRLVSQIDRVLEKNGALVADLQAAYNWVGHIAACLRYPPASFGQEELCSQQVADEMCALMQHFRPDFKRQPAQSALYHAWRHHWYSYGAHLLHCYDISGLPPDNLQIEALFGHLRRHQRRISGRSSTKELRNHGHYQVLFMAESDEDLLRQIQAVPLAQYQAHRRQMNSTQTPDQFLSCLHHDPVAAMQRWSQQYVARCAQVRVAPAVLAVPGLLHTD